VWREECGLDVSALLRQSIICSVFCSFFSSFNAAYGKGGGHFSRLRLR
jgi:hypothetical protein